MKYDIVFVDLDGTLLRDDKSIPQENIDSIRKLINSGVEFVLCSGRSHMSLKQIEKQLGISEDEGYGIAFNGGSVYKRNPNIYNTEGRNYLERESQSSVSKLKKHELLFEESFDQKRSDIILKFCKNYNAERMCYTENMLCVEKMTPTVIEYSRNSVLLPRRVHNLVISIKSNINKIIMIGDNEELKKAEKDFKNLDIYNDVDCFFSAKRLLEFNPKNINKGSAIKYILNIKEFKGKKSLAIGDSYNDIPMFEACDFSVACANSDDEVKKHASAVTEKTNNDGVLSEIIERFII